MRELTGFQRDLLVVVGSLERPSGLEIKKELEHSRSVSLLSSRVYANLDDLVSMELVSKASSDGRTNSYSLTVSGIETVHEQYRWLESYLPVDDAFEGSEQSAEDVPQYASGGLG